MKRHVICFVEKAGFEPRTFKLGTKVECYDHCATRQVYLCNKKSMYLDKPGMYLVCTWYVKEVCTETNMVCTWYVLGMYWYIHEKTKNRMA
jgi:hypothetical protein